MAKKNFVKLVVSQHIPSYTTKAGNLVADFNNEQTFSSETLSEVSAEKVGLWAVCALKKYQRMKRLQRNIGFKMSKEVSMELTVNNRTEVVGMKFSLNLDRLNSLLERTPELFAEAFTLNPAVGNITRAKAIAYVSTIPSKVMIAKHATEELEVNLLEESVPSVPEIPVI